MLGFHLDEAAKSLCYIDRNVAMSWPGAILEVFALVLAHIRPPRATTQEKCSEVSHTLLLKTITEQATSIANQTAIVHTLIKKTVSTAPHNKAPDQPQHTCTTTGHTSTSPPPQDGDHATRSQCEHACNEEPLHQPHTDIPPDTT